ncbi:MULTISPECIES: DUF4142 domain-containing protein [unclassified Corallococcus]|uniref:DUF4142 domain-containing protein n=1 Tax=unclassified Corallococcus TaxID=2685029 RepID=UPI001A8D8004|nr:MULTISPECIES: DUF4142 domain-containing protein [unclassified Corallococcus]MBN9684566.1 DUF4142 domain-containing protein [Corallococcus sp. NCSPR001]WAS83961.1 DUF4142 domain-containing protein [Corallococcus sp. NCRR]
MRTAKFWMGTLLAGALALGYGCGSEANKDPAPQDVPQQQVPDAGTDAGVMLTLTDAQIARVLQVANEGEVMLGQYAAPLATEQAVIDFNNQMVTEHTAVKQRLDGVLAAQGITPEDSPLSLQLQTEVQQLMEVLGGPNAPPAGAARDLALISAQLTAHARVAFLADSLLTPQITNPALAQEATSERQAVQMHIDAATALQSPLVLPPATP